MRILLLTLVTLLSTTAMAIDYKGLADSVDSTKANESVDKTKAAQAVITQDYQKGYESVDQDKAVDSVDKQKAYESITGDDTNIDESPTKATAAKEAMSSSSEQTMPTSSELQEDAESAAKQKALDAFLN